MSSDPGLDKELERLGRILSKPAPQRRNLFHALTEGGDVDPPPTHTPAPLRNVNPNQFALPGMEEQSHPLARHVAAGVHFEMSTDWSHGEGGRGERQPWEHSLTARRGKHQLMGNLSWAASGQKRHESGAGHYPGEITWVGRHPASGNEAPQGLMTDMYKAGHGLNMGQSTVPIHSPDRTEAGEAWSAKTPHQAALRPKRYDFDWRPPEGIHPHEHRNLSQSQFNPPGNDQAPLPGMEAHAHERKVDLGHVLKNWIK